MHRFWVLFAVGIITCSAAVTLHDMHSRVERLEQTPRADPEQVARLRASLDNTQKAVQQALDSITQLRQEGERTREMREQLAALERDLQNASGELDVQRCKLEEWETDQPREVESLVSTHVEELRSGLDQRWTELSAVAEHALGVAQGARTEIEQGLARDEERMWRELVGPVVQLAGDETVGSGVLLASEPLPEKQGWRTYVVTAWHVVRDIEKDPEHPSTPVPVAIYAPDRSIQNETAHVVRFDPALDAALLELDSRARVECGATLATRERLHSARIFDQIYAVGCPLGNDPIPTFGEIADTDHIVDGARYWMISAPTYIGNSGGGIFDAKTHELMGIFSKIYTHGTLRPTVVPHMGLVVSIETMYDWLDEVHYAGLAPAKPVAPEVHAQPATANAAAVK
ncbi:MAG: trypsin-like peptidase domain-containing protein [Planctomycetes bacterium]|nr:trypsin-like peptidase domain-containing protein [Planctomycetota bacterium]